MFFLEHFNVFRRIIYFAGLAPISIKPDDQNLKSFGYLIPILFTSMLSICIVTFLLFFPHFSSYGPINTIINFSSLVSSLAMILTANGQCHCNKPMYVTIVSQIQQMENHCKVKYSGKLPHRKIEHSFRLKVVFIFILYFLSQGLVLSEAWVVHEPHGILSSFFTSMSRLIYPMVVLHAVLFSDIVAMFIRELNQFIQNSPIFFHSSSKLEFLKFIKLMHMDIWKLVVQINIYFGWNLIFLVINAFVYITYQLYWIFLTLQVKWNVLGIIEGAESLLYGMVSIFILVNSCQSSTREIKHLIENIEQYVFWTTDNAQLHYLKQEILGQITNLPIYITASEFFNIDRRLLTGIAASCCMYIIIIIQFFLAGDI